MRLAYFALAWSLVSCVNERHVVVRDSTTSPERRYVCVGAEKATAAPVCTDAKEDLPGADNGANTVLVAMPYQCKGRINEVYVRNAHTGTPTIFVRCATNETSATKLPAPQDGGT